MVVAAASAAVAVTLAVQPAFAAVVQIDRFGATVQLDTAPGNGAPSWVWVYGAGDNWAISTRAQYMYVGSKTIHTLQVGRRKSASVSTPEEVRAIRACVLVKYPRHKEFWSCSEWLASS
ncbi:hypothetical protein GCM10009534_27490 [Kribbella sandramycini]